MQKIIIFCFALFLFLNLPSNLAQSTGYGGSAPSYEEEYENEEISYGGGGNSGYGGSSGGGSSSGGSSSYGGSSGGGSSYGGSSGGGSSYGGSSGGGGSGYGSNTPSYEEEYENSQSYYGGYGSTPTYTYEENQETYETPEYGYGGTPSYNNVNNQTYTSQYEEAYEGTYEGGEYGGSGGKPNIPFVPTSLLTGFVVDIHFLAGDPRFQYIAYHYCSDLYPGYTQCDIYNGTESNSRLVATELIVTAEIFAQLPMQERKYWHSHAFAVKSGLLVSPNTPADQDLAVMSSVMNSYGKVTDFWHSYQNFPYGGAKLAYGLADASQVNETIANQMDQALGLSTTWQERAAARKNLNPTIIEGADAYLTTGEYPQYITQMFPVVGASETGENGGVVAEEGGAVAAEEGAVVAEEGGAVVAEESGVVSEGGEFNGGETSEVNGGFSGGENGENGQVNGGASGGENGENGPIEVFPEDNGEGENPTSG